MVAWYVDEGLLVLGNQWKKEHPGAVVYYIGDASHIAKGDASQHNPEPDGPLPGQDRGEVDAGDFMIGHGVTKADLRELADGLVESRDDRIYYVIFDGKICSSREIGGVPAWTWRKYNGDDQHTDHVHLSVNDKWDHKTSSWKLEDEPVRTPTWKTFDAEMPELKYGDDDDMWGGYRRITRAQACLNLIEKTEEPLTVDGNYGAKTAVKLAKVMAKQDTRSSSNGKVMGEPEWRALFGLGG
jgi:hypothetical protein